MPRSPIPKTRWRIILREARAGRLRADDLSGAECRYVNTHPRKHAEFARAVGAGFEREIADELRAGREDLARTAAETRDELTVRTQGE